MPASKESSVLPSTRKSVSPQKDFKIMIKWKMLNNYKELIKSEQNTV